VARDLHDVSGQTLAALKMSIASLQEQFEDNGEVSASLKNIADIADTALREIRTTSYLLHPPSRRGWSCGSGSLVYGWTLTAQRDGREGYISFQFSTNTESR
jgi:signal transduction histidine kinase